MATETRRAPEPTPSEAQTRVLFERVRSALDHTVDGEKRLSESLKEEDEYLRLAGNLLREHGGTDDVVEEYSAPTGVSGGARACIELLAHLCADMVENAHQLNVRSPQCLAVWWPERTPNAESALGDGGGLIRVHLGLLAQLRFFLHLVCDSLATITGDPELWGDDRRTLEEVRRDFLDMLDEYIGGNRVPLWKTICVHSGQRERFRRMATIAGLAYVVAHEIGHLAPDNMEYLQSALRRAGPPVPGRDFTEIQATARLNMELRADLAAMRLLLEWKPFEGNLWELARAVGPASVLAIQSSLFWFRAAMPGVQLEWTHPDPDLRIAGLCMGLGNPQQLDGITRAAATTNQPAETENSNRVQRFLHWLDHATGATVFRDAALKQGLADRGLSPVQRFAIYLARGISEKPT